MKPLLTLVCITLMTALAAEKTAPPQSAPKPPAGKIETLPAEEQLGLRTAQIDQIVAQQQYEQLLQRLIQEVPQMKAAKESLDKANTAANDTYNKILATHKCAPPSCSITQAEVDGAKVLQLSRTPEAAAAAAPQSR